MEQKDEAGSAKSRARYIWDHNKLAWVETAEEPVVEEVPAEPMSEEVPAEIAEEVNHVEAVEETGGLVYRGAFNRAVAIAIDVIVLFIVHSILAMVFGSETTVGETEETARMLPQWFLLLMGFAYFVGFWVWRGQTPGKMLMGAKVVRLDGSPVGFGRSVLRYIIFMVYGTAIAYTLDNLYVAIVIALLALVIIVFNRKKQGLHDLIAGTCVINTRLSVPTVYTAEEEPNETEQGPDTWEQA